MRYEHETLDLDNIINDISGDARKWRRFSAKGRTVINSVEKLLTIILRAVLVALGSAGVFQPFLFAQSSYPHRTLSIDSRYFFQPYSNKAIGSFGIEMIQLGSLPATLIFPADSLPVGGKRFLFYDARQLRNLGEGFALLVGSASLSLGFHLAYHEFGHGTRMAAIGYKPVYGHDGRVYNNFFSYYVASLFNFFSGWTYYDGLLFPAVYEEGWDLVISAAGVNNTMAFSEMIEDELYARGGHIGFATSYALGKLSPVGSGPAADLRDVAAYYQARGINIDRKKIATASLTSFFLSTTTYQLALQFVKLFMGERTYFSPWEFHGVLLPNTEFYLTRAGLSYKVRSGYRFDTWRVPFSVEHVVLGMPRTEIGVGVEKRFGAFIPCAEATLGRAVEIALRCHFRFDERLSFGAGYALHRKENLRGERVIASLKRGSMAHELFLRASYHY